MGGHEVLTAYDGPTTLATAPEFQPHVVLSDLGMPGMNGCKLRPTTAVFAGAVGADVETIIGAVSMGSLTENSLP